MRWCAPGFEQALDGLEAAVRAATWPAPPAGFELVTRPRPMRMVLRGTLPGPDGHLPVIVKWSRPDTVPDRLSKRLRGGKGAREGRTLRALARRGVSVPRVLALSDEQVDLLVTEELAGFVRAPAPDEATPAQVRAVAALLADAHAAGLEHRDLHAGNIGFVGDRPVIVDLGGARAGKPPTDKARRIALARARHGLLGGARRAQRLRALIAYMAGAGGGDGRAAARALSRSVEKTAKLVARRYRSGRDRRATRTGVHFVRYATKRAPRAIRWRDGTDETWERAADAWLAADPEGASSLKAGGAVLRVPGPAGNGAVVLKRYEAVAAGRLPRPLRAFRRAYALQNRHVAVPQPLLAAVGEDGSGIYAAAEVEAPDLHAFTGGGTGGSYGELPPNARHRLHETLGRALRAMHDSEVSHRDLKAPNLLVASGTGREQVWIVDLEGARVRRRPVPWSRRARDLARLDASLGAHATDRLRVLKAYMNVLPRPPVTLRQMAGRIAEHVRRKRGPSGAPR